MLRQRRGLKAVSAAMQSESVVGWQIPKPLAVGEARLSDGAVTWLRRHGNPEGPRIVLSHGNGLSVDAYYPFWSLLVEYFDLVLYDFRNHGWNAVGDLQAHQFSTFVDDNNEVLSAIDTHFGGKPKIGVFHSMSATTAVLQKSEAFSALVLFDPPTCPHGRASQDFRKIGQYMAEAASKRQSWFKSPDELTARLLRSSAYKHMLPGVADLIARTTLRPAENGYVFCCPPDYEAQIGRQLYDVAVASDINNLPCPVKVIGADPTVPFSFLPSVDLSTIDALDYDFVPETTHFLQLEQPAACLAQMLDFLERRKLV